MPTASSHQPSVRHWEQPPPCSVPGRFSLPGSELCEPLLRQQLPNLAPGVLTSPSGFPARGNQAVLATRNGVCHHCAQASLHTSMGTPVWSSCTVLGWGWENLPGGCPSAQDGDSPVFNGRYPSTYSEDVLVPGVGMPWPSVGMLQSMWGYPSPQWGDTLTLSAEIT